MNKLRNSLVVVGINLPLVLFLVGSLPCLAQTNDPFAPKPELPPGFQLVGGDIIVPIYAPKSPKSPFPSDPNKFWPGGIVPFEFDSNVNAANQAAMLSAMAVWQGVATVQFVVRNGQGDYAHIQNSTGNNSQIGRVGGQQIINITSWGSQFTIVHELGHCLAFDHTQSRSDRASYIAINTDNIQPAYKNQFDVSIGFNDYGPYDFDSVMEYGQCSFSIDCAAGSTCGCTHHVIDVLAPNDGYWQSRIGQRSHLSAFDKLTMSFLYPASNWRFLDRNFTGSPESGTFLRPYKTFAVAEAGVPTAGTLWIQPGAYSAFGTHSKPMTLKAPLGSVILSN